MVTWCTNQFNIQPTVGSAHTVFMCVVFIWGQTATCATYSINWLVFITEMKSVYSAVRTGSLNKGVCASSLRGYPDWGFPWFSSVVKQMPGYRMQSRGTARNPLPQARRLHLSAWKKSQTSSLRLSQSGLRTQIANQAKFIPPIISLVPSRR